MNIDKAIAKVRNTNWQDWNQRKLVNELEELFNNLKYVSFRKTVTKKDIKEFFQFEDTQAVAIKMILG